MPDAPAELDELLARLVTAGVEFVLVGGAAALVHGAPITTQDVDLVHRRTDLARRKLPPTAQADIVDLDGVELRVIDLETLIEIKASTGRAKDRLVVPILLEVARLRAQQHS